MWADRGTNAYGGTVRGTNRKSVEETTIEITFVSQKTRGGRGRQREAALWLVGTAAPYGEVEIWAGTAPRLATVTAIGLPPVEIRHPDPVKEVPFPIEASTVLTVGGVRAVLSSGRGLRKVDRAAQIELGGRSYTYGAADRDSEELRDGGGAPLVHIHGRQEPRVSTADISSPADLALALAFLLLDTEKLTMGRLAVRTVNDVFNSGRGEGF